MDSAFTIQFPRRHRDRLVEFHLKATPGNAPSDPRNLAAANPFNSGTSNPLVPGLPGGNDPIVAPARAGSWAWGMSTDLPGRQTAQEPKIQGTQIRTRTQSLNEPQTNLPGPRTLPDLIGPKLKLGRIPTRPLDHRCNGPTFQPMMSVSVQHSSKRPPPTPVPHPASCVLLPSKLRAPTAWNRPT